MESQTYKSALLYRI